ncbi:MAG: prolyl oligopeptidase family serine peptidase, partial [Paramuribaculum sp.]|nr:prolyl oligopeptidase family serine peptidase [Paramuribaculum sp.]
LATLADNTKGAYASRWAGKPMREFFTFTTAEGVELNGYMIKPKGFDPSRRYPVVMYQYSGPGSQQVLNLWSINWATYYAEQGYIVACVDGRGTGGRGRAFMDAVYKRLGHFETIDQIAAARYIASLPFVDGSRIGMHGWSYGGYETLMAVTADDSPYAAAVAVAPVTDWRFYDTIYAERYMLTPQENETGYEQSAPLFRTDRVKAPLLVMWGTADDNVHPANSIEFIARMESEGNYCDLLLFPNMDHSINGCGSRALVFARMLDYFNTQMK